MTEVEQNPKFKMTPNRPEIIRLKSNEPFWSGENTYGKMNYGYNMKSNGKDYTWFASEAVSKILNAANVQSDTEFTLELRNGTTKDGNPYNIYLLNGKSLRDWSDPIMQDQPVENTAPVEDTQKVDKLAVHEALLWIEKAQKVIADLNKKVDVLMTDYGNRTSDAGHKPGDDELPF